MPSMNVNVVPPNATIPDSTQPVMLGGKQGEGVFSQLHGRWFNASVRGKLFQGTTALAGTIIPINASNLVSTFAFWNPVNSGVNAELVDLDLGVTTTVLVVAAIGLVYQASVGSQIANPGTLTALTTVTGGVIGAANPGNKCTLYSALTFVGTPTPLMPLFAVPATTGVNPTPLHYEFDGKIIVPPGAIVALVSTAAQTAAMQQKLAWAEWPI